MPGPENDARGKAGRLPVALAVAVLAIASAGVIFLAQRRPAEPGVVVPRPVPADLLAQPPAGEKPVMIPARMAQVQLIAHGCAAEIFIDGASMGQTPKDAIAVQPGQHVLRLASPSCDPPSYEETMLFPGGSSKTFERTFKPR